MFINNKNFFTITDEAGDTSKLKRSTSALLKKLNLRDTTFNLLFSMSLEAFTSSPLIENKGSNQNIFRNCNDSVQEDTLLMCR